MSLMQMLAVVVTENFKRMKINQVFYAIKAAI